MTSVTRRTVLSTAAAVPFAAWLESRGLARGQGASAAKRVRCEARTTQGIEMLKVYASAVKAMKDTTKFPEGDPRSWLFQWYSHFVSGATTKNAEIARIYTNPADPNRATAVAMWDMCQPHSAGQNEDFFLPWHRCFVYYFEKIIAAVSNCPTFALPYWNYSTSDPATRGIIPPQFVMPSDPTFGSLFEGLRRSVVNQGQPIQGNNQSLLSLDALLETSYSPTDAAAGFNMALDQGLHGNVHVRVGAGQNMGSVPFAARDPIFWMHHCNIDRLWGSWNAAGNTNTPLNQTFTFADGTGTAVVVNISDFLNLDALDYTYDRFEPVPGAIPGPSAAAPTPPPAPPQVAAASPDGGIALGAAGTQVRLAPTPPAAGPVMAAPTVPGRVARVRPGARIYLKASGLAANVQPGVVYNLYLDLPANPTPQQVTDHYVGSINFFGVAHGPGGHGAAPAAAAPAPAHGAAPAHGGPVHSKFVSFDITGKVRALGVNKVLGEKPVLTIQPDGAPEAAAAPVIGRVELVVH